MVGARWSIVGNRILVETDIEAALELVWQYTQTPELHERWDIRFSSIEYLPRQAGDPTQRFAYGRKLLPGLTIRGTGETVGDRWAADGTATSALRFGSDDPLSLIRRGSGYWKYVPIELGVRFLTGYDYEPRWGVVGRLIDRLIFRRAMAWATARSFDRLRTWLETGVEP
jgi:hypothetical protein